MCIVYASGRGWFLQRNVSFPQAVNQINASVLEFQFEIFKLRQLFIGILSGMWPRNVILLHETLA